MNLAQAELQKQYLIQDLIGDSYKVHRLLELGFIVGEEIKIIQKILFGDPLIVEIQGARIALRKTEAECILISN